LIDVIKNLHYLRLKSFLLCFWLSVHCSPTDIIMSLGLIFNKKLSYCCDSRSYCMQYYDGLKQLLRDLF